MNEKGHTSPVIGLVFGLVSICCLPTNFVLFLSHQQAAAQVNPNLPAFLKVIVRVNNTGGGSAQPSDFHIGVSGKNPDPGSFDGSEKGTIVTLEKGAYSISSSHLAGNTTYGTFFSGDCALNVGLFTNLGYGGGEIGPGDRKICILTEIFPNFK